MKTKVVNRYYCDFCKKSGCCKSAMVKHEARCTMNPGRECGLHEIMQQAFECEPAPPISTLLAMLPEPQFKWDGDVFDRDELDAAIIEVEKAACGCPTCTLSALRQKGWTPMACYDTKAKIEAIFREINESQQTISNSLY